MTRLIGYIDAGSGSLLLQALAGGAAATAVVAKVYWGRLKRFFGFGKVEEEQEPTP